MPDYVHMMISFPTDIAPSNVVKSLKGTSAREWFKLHSETKKLLWNPSFFMSTIDNVSKDIVANYIENQMLKSIGHGKNIQK